MTYTHGASELWMGPSANLTLRLVLYILNIFRVNREVSAVQGTRGRNVCSAGGGFFPVVYDSRAAQYSRRGHAQEAGMNRYKAEQYAHNRTCDTLHAGWARRCGIALSSESTGHSFIEMKCLQWLINRVMGLRHD